MDSGVAGLDEVEETWFEGEEMSMRFAWRVRARANDIDANQCARLGR